MRKSGKMANHRAFGKYKRKRKKYIGQTNYVYLFIICMNLSMCKCVLFQFTLLLPLYSLPCSMRWLKVLLFSFLFLLRLFLFQENISYEINGFDKHKQHKMNAGKCCFILKIREKFRHRSILVYSHQFRWLHEFCAFVEFHTRQKKLQRAPNSLSVSDRIL